jgi:hypothetical protein
MAVTNEVTYSQMMTRSLSAKRIVILSLLAFASGSCKQFGSVPNDGRDRSLPRFEEIEALAEQICECRMAGRDARVLSAKLAELTRGLKTNELSTREYPVYSVLKCIPQLGEHACIGQEYLAPFPGDDAHLVCTSEQQAELESLWKLMKNRDSADDHGILEKRLSGMRKDMATKIPQSACTNL